jgi:hypothetical protein
MDALSAPENAYLVDLVLARIVNQVRSGAPADAVPLIKDPRLTLLGSSIIRVLGERATIVLCLRHPLDVARSLHRSEGADLLHALAIWETYYATACRALGGHPVHVFWLPLALSRAEVTLDLVRRVLGPREVSAEQLRRATEHLARHLHHEDSGTDDEDEWLSVAQKALWSRLRDAALQKQPVLLESATISRSALHHLANMTDAVAPIVAATRRDLGNVTARLHELMTQNSPDPAGDT